jgi:hypothetical protein
MEFNSDCKQPTRSSTPIREQFARKVLNFTDNDEEEHLVFVPSKINKVDNVVAEVNEVNNVNDVDKVDNISNSTNESNHGNKIDVNNNNDDGDDDDDVEDVEDMEDNQDDQDNNDEQELIDIYKRNRSNGEDPIAFVKRAKYSHSTNEAATIKLNGVFNTIMSDPSNPNTMDAFIVVPANVIDDSIDEFYDDVKNKSAFVLDIVNSYHDGLISMYNARKLNYNLMVCELANTKAYYYKARDTNSLKAVIKLKNGLNIENRKLKSLTNQITYLKQLIKGRVSKNYTVTARVIAPLLCITDGSVDNDTTGVVVDVAGVVDANDIESNTPPLPDNLNYVDPDAVTLDDGYPKSDHGSDWENAQDDDSDEDDEDGDDDKDKDSQGRMDI